MITPFEYTSSGIAGSIPAYDGAIAADRAVWLTPAVDHYAPATENTNLHTECEERDPYIVATRDENAVHATYVAELRSGNVVGFKYLDFGDETSATLRLLTSPEECAPAASVAVWLDAPAGDLGGTLIGNVALTCDGEAEAGTDGRQWYWSEAAMDTPVSGVHGVYFVFNAESDDMIGGFDQFEFVK